METGSLVMRQRLASLGIAALCFGYFAAYVPYSAMTKMATKGLFAGMGGAGLSGFEVQFLALLGNFVAMIVFISLARWWKHAKQWRCCGLSLPRPRWFTFISGLCAGGIIITTTLSYSFGGISIVFAMLLMRGGVLVMAPIVDVVARRRKRKIYWPSWVAATLSLGALLVAFGSDAGTAMTVVAAIDVVLYLFCYFFRLLFMSNRAKSDDQSERKGYMVEEQMTSGPAILIAVIVVGLIGAGMAPSSIPGQLWSGMTKVLGGGYAWHIFLIGVLSYGTGLFGSLIMLDRRENTFTIPANRISSIIAGVLATYFLAVLYEQRYPDLSQLIGVALVIAAITFLAYRSVVEKRDRNAIKAPAPASNEDEGPIVLQESAAPANS